MYGEKNMINWFQKLSRASRNSLAFSLSLVGFTSTVLSVLGVSLRDCECLNLWTSLLVVIIVFSLVYLITFYTIKRRHKKAVKIRIKNTSVSIIRGDIFKEPGWKVIGCDSHFDFRIDDIVINKNSLHGKVFLEHGKTEEIKEVIEKEANRLGLEKDCYGQYSFPLGTIIKYESSVDNETYLLLAMNNLDKDYRAVTSMGDFEQMLTHMWNEIDRVYAQHNIVIPLLGSMITRFKEGPRDTQGIMKCMLCTLANSDADLSSKVSIVLFGDKDGFDLYELKNLVS